jgi:hypothetical protein
MLRSFERSVSLDTVYNELVLHRRVHAWFAASAAFTRRGTELVDKVYDELFATPRSDPWLGLRPRLGYSALDGGGVIAASE